MNIKDIITETTAGAVATVAVPLGGMKKRPNASVFPKTTSKKKKKKTVGEGKSPHKKGTKKYKKHMAAMHAEDVNDSGMIGKPDSYYDEEDRKEAYNDLQDALAQSDSTEAEYVKDGYRQMGDFYTTVLHVANANVYVSFRDRLF